jgi:hypothetical protein
MIRRLPKLDESPEDEMKRKDREMMKARKIMLKKPQRKRG